MPHDSIRVRSLMHWPDEDARTERRQFFAADLTNRMYRDAEEGAFVPAHAGLMMDLLDGPRWSEMLSLVRERSKGGLIAGHVFLAMYFMELWKEKLPRRGAKEPSLAKGFHFLDWWARNGGTWGNGDPLPKLSKIKQGWAEYRNVSHLWAAVLLNDTFPYAPKGALFHPDYFRRLMETAAYLQAFGMALRLQSRVVGLSETLLADESVWAVDLRYQPREPRVKRVTEIMDIESSVLYRALREYTSG